MINLKGVNLMENLAAERQKVLVREITKDDFKNLLDLIVIKSKNPKELIGFLQDVMNIPEIKAIKSLEKPITATLKLAHYNSIVTKLDMAITRFKTDPQTKKFIIEEKSKAPVFPWDKSKTTHVIDHESVLKRKDELGKMDLGTQNELKSELSKIKIYESSKILRDLNQDRVTKAGLNSVLSYAEYAGNAALAFHVDNKTVLLLKDSASKTGMGIMVIEKGNKLLKEFAQNEKAPDFIKNLVKPENTLVATLKRYETVADYIMERYSRVKDLNLKENKGSPEYNDAKRTRNLVIAAGCNLKDFIKLKDKPVEQRKQLVAAMLKPI